MSLHSITRMYLPSAYAAVQTPATQAAYRKLLSTTCTAAQVDLVVIDEASHLSAAYTPVQ
ncbi:hypothetical protein [Pseudomonas taiwanensis]